MKKIAIVLIVFAVMSVLALSNWSVLAAPMPQALGQGSFVVLRADPNVVDFHVPAPSQFTQLHAQTATITVNYLAAGTKDEFGTTCYAWPQSAKNAFDYAASIWESLVTSPIEIRIHACWASGSELGTGVLGYGGADDYYRNFAHAPLTNTYYPVALANALAGSDLNGADPDMHVAYSMDYSWYYGVDGNTPGGQYDFASVVLHEICHGLGFSGSMYVKSGLGYWGWAFYSDPSAYDRFTENGAGQSLLSFGNGTSALAGQLQGNSVYFDGPQANAANGGARPKLYAPTTWSQGSSYSHLDEIFNGTGNALMTYSLGFAESEHAPGPVAMGILKDLGWTTTTGGNPAPIVTAITPGSDQNTGSISITNLAGANFQSGATVRLTKSSYSDVNATGVTVVNSNTITCLLNLSGTATGPWNVVVTHPDDQSGTLLDGFAVYGTATAPTVTGITPDVAESTGVVTITHLAGTNFQVGAVVKLTRLGQADISAAHVTVVSSNTITCTFDVTGAAWGLWNVVVSNPNAEKGWLTEGFRVIGPEQVYLPAVLRNSGPASLSLPNGGFESGPVIWTEYSRNGWKVIVSSGLPGGVTPHGGSWLAWLGGGDEEISYVQQQVQIPVGSPYLAYWHWIGSSDWCGYDFGGVIINGTTVVDVYDLCASSNTGGWVKHVVNLSAFAGQSVWLQIRAETDESLNSNLFVDDVSFQTSATAVEGTPVLLGADDALPKPGASTSSRADKGKDIPPEFTLRQVGTGMDGPGAAPK